MGWLNTILVRKARRFLWRVTGGMFVVLLALSCVEVKSSCSDVWDEAMNILFYLWLMILVVSLGVTIVVACCEKKWGWLPRIFFYGLFLGGVYVLILSHTLCCEAPKRDSMTVEVLDVFGLSMLVVWLVWLVVAVLSKLKPKNLRHNKTEETQMRWKGYVDFMIRMFKVLALVGIVTIITTVAFSVGRSRAVLSDKIQKVADRCVELDPATKEWVPYMVKGKARSVGSEGFNADDFDDGIQSVSMDWMKIEIQCDDGSLKTNDYVVSYQAVSDEGLVASNFNSKAVSAVFELMNLAEKKFGVENSH